LLCRASSRVVGVEGERALSIRQAGSGIVAQPRHPQQSRHVGRIAGQDLTKHTPCFGLLSLLRRGFTFS
jgi:hypothetical protein